MTTRTSIRIAAFAVFLLAAGSALADGLQRFQQEVLPRLPKDELAYETAVPLGLTGFALGQVTLRDPNRGWPGAGPLTLRAKRLAVEDVDYDRLGTREPPHMAKLRLDGVISPNAARYGAFWRSLGISDTPSDVRVDYRFDPKTQTLTINRFEVAAAGVSRLSLESVLRNVRSLSPADARQWTESVAVQSLKLQYDDQSALRRMIRAYAEQQGKSESALIQEWTTGIAVMLAGKGGRTAAAADALVSFLHDYQRPKGRLQISLMPSKPLKVGDLMVSLLGADPAQATGLDIAYAGTRPGAVAALLGR